MAHGCDWLPTIAELCGVDLPEKAIDGKSLVTVIKDTTTASPHERLHWMVGRDPQKAQWAVRERDWKLIGNARDTTKGGKHLVLKEPFLVNLADDPSEVTNLAEKHPDVVKRLTEYHRSVVGSIGGSSN